MLRRTYLSLAAAAFMVIPISLHAQEKSPAPAPPDEKPQTVPDVQDAAPKAEADGVARVPSSPAGCGPANRACGPNGVCGPQGGFLSGNCNTGGYCQSGPGGLVPCQTGPNGMPCFAAPGTCMTPEQCFGRGYTIGDLKRGFYSWKCNLRSEFRSSEGGGACSSWLANERFKHNCRRAYRNRLLAAHLKNKFNYFVPSGCCGEGCPPIGKYSRVYAANPGYFDQRDGQLFAAPATGVPTAIPLAPNVRHQYNYGWGIPSSRLTPISTIGRPRP